MALLLGLAEFPWVSLDVTYTTHLTGNWERLSKNMLKDNEQNIIFSSLMQGIGVKRKSDPLHDDMEPLLAFLTHERRHTVQSLKSDRYDSKFQTFHFLLCDLGKNHLIF